MRLIQFLLPLIATALLGQQYSFLPVPGSPQSIRDMLQDRTGRLWIATSSDVECFDGTRFYSLHEFGFPAVQALAIAEDQKGAIWIASGAGLHRFFAGRLEKVRSGFGTAVAAITPDVVLASIGDDSGIPEKPTLFRVQRMQGRWKVDRLMDLPLGGQFSRDTNNKIIYLCSGGWCETDIREIVNWQPGKQVTAMQHRVPVLLGGSNARILRDRFGCVWFRSDTKSYYQCPQDATAKEIESSANPSIIRETENGDMMIPASASLTIGRPGAFRVLNAKTGMPFPGDVLESRDGSIWIAGSGLFRWAYPFRLEFWTERDGIDDLV
jgi:Two component regulator propeller